MAEVVHGDREAYFEGLDATCAYEDGHCRYGDPDGVPGQYFEPLPVQDPVPLSDLLPNGICASGTAALALGFSVSHCQFWSNGDEFSWGAETTVLGGVGYMLAIGPELVWATPHAEGHDFDFVECVQGAYIVSTSGCVTVDWTEITGDGEIGHSLSVGLGPRAGVFAGIGGTITSRFDDD